MSQAPVKHTTEGDRGGNLTSRKHVSPLGGAKGDQMNMSKQVENAQQPYKGYGGSSKPEGMAG